MTKKLWQTTGGFFCEDIAMTPDKSELVINRLMMLRRLNQHRLDRKKHKTYEATQRARGRVQGYSQALRLMGVRT